MYHGTAEINRKRSGLNMKNKILLDFLLEKECIGLLDRHFADFILRLLPDDPLRTSLALAGALASHAASRDSKYGMCMPVPAVDSMSALLEYLQLDPEELPDVLKEWDWLPLQEQVPVLSKNGNTLLILSHGMVYLNGIYRGEQRIIRFLKDRLDTESTPSTVDPLKFTKLPLKDEQVLAIQKAVNSKFHIISGGPGTGKTTIIALLLALRKELREDSSAVYLCAPTGKAQARMKEAILEELSKFTPEVPDDLKKRIASLPCSTIHRLLKNNPETNTFRYNKDNKLHCDLLIVDECSMISEKLMISLLDAMQDQTAVIMLGDKAQLSSVEPGSVFADFMDICENRENALSKLKKSVRFDPTQGIGKLKDILESPCENMGKIAWETLCNNPQQIMQYDLPAENEFLPFLNNMLKDQKFGGWIDKNDIPWFDAPDLDSAWQRFESLRILSPVHNGLFGVISLNEMIRTLFRLPSAPVKAGMTFLILKNTAELDLFNGDIGMLWHGKNPMEPCTKEDPECTGLFVFFPVTDDRGKRIWRGIPPQYLPEHDDAYAISVHKSQGSGYGKILFFLPGIKDEKHAGLLTRELVYTGITRAKQQTILICNEKTFSAAAELAAPRSGGLYTAFMASEQEKQ